MREARWRNWPGIVILTLFSGSVALGKQEEEEVDLRRQIEELKKGQDEIRKELAEIKRLLQAPPGRAPAPAPVAPDVRNLVGSALLLHGLATPLKRSVTLPS